MTTPPPRWIVSFVLVLCGCGDPPPRPLSMTVRDSAGVRIVEHAADATPTARWTIDLAAATEYAMPDGDVPLYRVAGALRLPDGRVVAADGGNARLVVFSSDGSMEATFGRQGDGPGEFRGIQLLRPWIGDSLIVWDDRARRLSVMTADAGFARSFGLSLPEGVPFARVVGVYPDGSFLGMSFTNFGQQPAPGITRSPIRLHHFATDGAHLAVAGEVPGIELLFAADGSGAVSLFPPHFYRDGNHVAGERLLVAPNDRWELSFRSPTGEVQEVVRWWRPSTPVTAAATAASLAQLIERTPEPRRAATREIAGELDIHDTMPAFGEVFYDRIGRVWLQAYDPSDGDLIQWTVVGAEGELQAEMTVPRTLRFRDAGADWLLVRALDELDVEHLLLATIDGQDAPSVSPPAPAVGRQ